MDAPPAVPGIPVQWFPKICKSLHCWNATAWMNAPELITSGVVIVFPETTVPTGGCRPPDSHDTPSMPREPARSIVLPVIDVRTAAARRIPASPPPGGVTGPGIELPLIGVSSGVRWEILHLSGCP